MRVEGLEKFWTDKHRYELAEKQYHEGRAKIDGISLEAGNNSEVLSRLSALENENKELKAQVADLRKLYTDVVKRLQLVEDGKPIPNGKTESAKKAEDDDDVDLFASESEEENDENARIREERLAAYAAKKSKKAVIIAKSSLILDVKPWDDETDLKVMETEIRKITLDGLLWGASKFVPVAFGIQKLSISCVVEDDKVSIDWLTEEIEKLEDFVQSVDVAAFNKI